LSIFEFQHRHLNHIRPLRVQHHELIGVKTGSKLVRLDEFAAFLEPTYDFISVGQIIDPISAHGMRLDGKNLAVHPEAADAVVSTELESSEQGVGILHAETAQLRQSVGTPHFADGCRRRRDELDRLVPKLAAEAKANHVFPQFIAVIDSCSTVASDTQTK
jgi:hypothetical protein